MVSGYSFSLSNLGSGKFNVVPGLVIATCEERGISVVAYS